MSSCATWLRRNRRSGRRSIAIFDKAIEDKKFQEEVEKDESLNFLLRDTISLTMMGGSEQTNVIPPEAWANLDVRILPGGDPKALLEAVRKVVNDPNVTRRANQRRVSRGELFGDGQCVVCGDQGSFRRSIFRERRWCRTSLVGIRRISGTGLWGLRRMGSILIRRRRKKETPSTGTMSGFGWRKCGGGRGYCLMWWRRWRRSKDFLATDRTDLHGWIEIGREKLVEASLNRAADGRPSRGTSSTCAIHNSLSSSWGGRLCR